MLVEDEGINLGRVRKWNRKGSLIIFIISIKMRECPKNWHERISG